MAGRRRRTVNIPFNVGFSASASTQTVNTTDLMALGLGDMGISVRPGMTIVRIRGNVSLQNTSTPLAQVQSHIAVALLDEAQAAFDSIASEVVNVMWRLDTKTRGLVWESSADTFTGFPDVYPIETRGKRMITRVGQKLVTVVNLGAGSTINVNMAGTVRLMLE